MPSTSTPRADGGYDARIVPGDTKRLTIPNAADGPFMVGVRNLATNVAALLQATTSLAGDENPVLLPFGKADGSLAPGAHDLTLVQARIAALIVTVPEDADGDVIVNVLA